MTTSALTDELALRGLVARFSDAVNRRDIDAFADLWRPDGVWDLTAMGRVEGVDAIVEWVTRLLDSWELFVQMTHSGVVTIDGDRAQMRWIMQEVGRSRDGAGLQNHGIYHDDAVRGADGQWRFARRTYQFLHVDPTSPVVGEVHPPAAAVGTA